MTAEPLRRTFTTDEVYRMLAAGILTEDDRVELIEGELLRMTPINSRRSAVLNRLIQAFARRLGDRAILSAQNPVRLGERSEPQPDLCLLVPRDDFYAERHPGPEDVLLLVEISETSLGYDREVKLPLYARHGIPEVWIADLVTGEVAVHRDPDPATGRYLRTERRGPGERVAPAALPELGADVGELVPR